MSPVGSARVSRYSQLGNVIPDSVVNNADNFWPYADGSGTTATDKLGSTDISLNNGGTWLSDARFYYGEAASFDQVDDFYLASSLGINDTQFSVGKWIEVTEHDDYARVLLGGDNSSAGAQISNGWTIYFNGTSESLAYIVESGGSQTTISSSWGTMPLNERCFLAVTGDGSAHDAYLYDSTQSLIGSVSGSGARGTDANGHLLGMAGDGRYTGGFVDATAASTTTAWSQTTIESIMADTA